MIGHRRAARVLASLLALAGAACASIQAPPGGPEDHDPPKVVSITPDTGKLNVTPKEVVFRFDEVVNERPGGAANLDQMFVVSPSDGAPRVNWHRTYITVRPRHSFRPNTAYTVTMLPGFADLRGNTLHTGATTFFSTGGDIPRTALRGVIFDWVAGKPAVGAIIEAFRRGDTTFAWTAVSDSTGRFELRAFPAGSYLVRGLVDANHNRVLDPHELFDTVGVAVADSGRIELLAFAHDTIGPRIDRIAVEDSVTLRVDFDRPIDPAHPLTTTNFVLLRSDSARIPIAELLTDSAFTSQRRVRDSVRADSLRAARAASGDTTRPAPAAAPAPTTTTTIRPATPPAATPGGTGSAIPLPRRQRAAATQAAVRDTTPLPKPSRPSPQSLFHLRLGTPLTPVTAYRLRAIDVRGLGSNPRTSDRGFATPKPTPPDSAARRSSTGAAPNGAPPPRPVQPTTRP